jgi:hypothetical protein
MWFASTGGQGGTHRMPQDAVWWMSWAKPVAAEHLTYFGWWSHWLWPAEVFDANPDTNPTYRMVAIARHCMAAAGNPLHVGR